MKKIEQLSPKEINSQKRDLFITYRSNSQVHYKDISSFDYEHRIRLNPSGEAKTMDIRNQIPVSHIRDSFVKSELSCPKNNNQATAYEKAEIEEKINFHSINWEMISFIFSDLTFISISQIFLICLEFSEKYFFLAFLKYDL